MNAELDCIEKALGIKENRDQQCYKYEQIYEIECDKALNELVDQHNIINSNEFD